MAVFQHGAPAGIGGLSVEMMRRAEEEERLKEEMRMYLQQLGQNQQFSLGQRQNEISGARQEADAFNAIEAQALSQQRQDEANAIAEQANQRAWNLEYNQIQQVNADRRAQQGAISGGNFGLPSQYLASLEDRNNGGFFASQSYGGNYRPRT